MEELKETLLQAKADVISGIQNAKMFSNPEQAEKELSEALFAINRAIADINEQLSK